MTRTLKISFDLVPNMLILTVLFSVLQNVQGSSSSVNRDFHHKLSIDLNMEAKDPAPITIFRDRLSDIEIHYNYSDFQMINTSAVLWQNQICIKADLRDGSRKAEIKGRNIFFVNKSSSFGSFSVQVKGILPGRVLLDMEVMQCNENGSVLLGNVYREWNYLVFVEIEDGPIEKLFLAGIIVLILIANIGMGCKTNLDIVKEELKKPIAPLIGMCSQFLFMPMVAFVFAYSLNLDPGIALGFFTLGCSPGGSASNAWTHLMRGSVSLSVTMTLISTLSALGFLPLWLFTLGQVLYNAEKVVIPFTNIFATLLGIITPIVIGILIQKRFPRLSDIWIKTVPYVMAFFLLFCLSLGTYAYWYIFLLIDIPIILAAASIPYLGFLFGGFLSMVFKQKRENVIAIAVETGIQNTGIPILILQASLSGPDKFTSLVPPTVSAIFTPLPLAVVTLCLFLRRRRKLKNNRDYVAANNGHRDSADELNEMSDVEFKDL